jgi:hypothetical protein
MSNRFVRLDDFDRAQARGGQEQPIFDDTPWTIGNSRRQELSTESERRFKNGKVIGIVAVVACVLAAPKVIDVVSDFDSTASSTDISGADSDKKDREERKGFSESPESFLPQTFCEPTVDIVVDDTYVPIKWNTAAYDFDDGDFPARVSGSASFVTCLEDISAISYSKAKSNDVGVATYVFDSNAVKSNLDVEDLNSYIVSMEVDSLLEVLRESDPSAEAVDAQAVIGQIEAQEPAIDTLNLELIVKEAIRSRASSVFDLQTQGIRDILQSQAEAQGINPNRIRFVEASDSSERMFQAEDPPETITDQFEYRIEQAYPSVTVTPHNTEE